MRTGANKDAAAADRIAAGQNGVETAKPATQPRHLDTIGAEAAVTQVRAR